MHVPSSPAAALFAGPVQLVEPSVAERYEYKKHGGSSDTSRQRDEFE